MFSYLVKILSLKIGILDLGVNLPILCFDASVIKSICLVFKSKVLINVFALAAAPIPAMTQFFFF